MAAVPRVWREAAERWGWMAEGEAHKYGVKNGATLLLKIASGESGFNMGAVSSAGARGGTQFMPGTRESFIKQYGVDPWKSPDEAMHATAIFMKTRGLAGYNPGDSSYISYILGQKVSAGAGRRGGGGRALPGGQSEPPSHSSAGGGIAGDLMHVGLVAALVLGGVVMVGMGTTKMLGTSRRPA